MLVTSAGTGTAFGLIRAIRSQWGDEVRVVAADIHPAEWVTSSILADSFVRLPPFASAEYPSVLTNVLATQHVDRLLPVSDPEIAIAASIALASTTTLHVPFEGSRAVAVANDKWAIYQACVAAGLRVPATRLLPAGETVSDCVVKSRSGFGSRGVHVVPAGHPHPAPANHLVQATLAGPEITIDAHRDATGKAWSACRERIETRAGVSTKCRIYQDASLHSTAVALLEAFGVASLCFQVMHDENRQPCITDVNFRTGAGTSMSACAGYDFHAALAGSLLGVDTARFFPEFRPVTVTRQYSDFVMSHGAGA